MYRHGDANNRVFATFSWGSAKNRNKERQSLETFLPFDKFKTSPEHQRIILYSIIMNRLYFTHPYKSLF
jgi:hypothetical protein